MWKFLLFCLVLLGCSNGNQEVKNLPHYNIFVDDSFTANHKILIVEALEEWRQITKEKIEYRLEFINSSEMGELKDANAVYIYSKNPDPKFIGYTFWNATNNSAFMTIALNIIEDAQFKAVIMHELGHAWHLGHYNLPNLSIMHPVVYGTSDIACPDIIAFCKEWYCTADCLIIPEQTTDDNAQATDSNNEEKTGVCRLPANNPIAQ